MNINKAIQLAFEHHQQGNLKQAEDLYKRILKKQPVNVDVLHMLGVVYSQNGSYELAVEYIRKSLTFNPSNYHAYYNLGNAYRESGENDEAINSYEKALHLNPYFTDAHYNLGILFQNKGQLDEAITCYQKVIKLEPTSFQAYFNLGNAFRDKKQIDEAITCYRETLKLNPVFVGAYCNLGNIIRDKGDLEEAELLYRKAIHLDPDFAEAYNNLGDVLQDKGQYDEAITNYSKALQRNPNLIESKWNISLIDLLFGKFEEGWKGLELSWQLKDNLIRHCSRPLWDGADIAGRTILLHEEQGFGDIIQFVRYAPLVAQRGAKVIVECQKELTSLMKTIEGVHWVVAYDEQLPEFDVHCPLLRLPFIFNTNLETIPANVPYIMADSLVVEHWKDKLKSDNAQLKIGLVWAGNPTLKGDLFRSCSLETFSPFAHFKDITFYSLQKWKSAEQAKNPPVGMRLIDYTDEIRDFSDTAAFIENLDLIISVDTAVAHLAGAMGRPVWTLLPFAPDWRWMLNREDSPWYPTMRLFRQSSWGDWKSVINRMKEELRESSGV
jgi:tetratricopeptide (TPR) repeat protein